jgi:predicted DNA-binding transcriptional regulator AlpA
MERSLLTPNAFASRGALTVAEFCNWAAIGRSSFYREVKEGRITLRKLGRKSVVTMADAEAWLNSLPVAE